jgi:hypothetical protein
MTFIAEFVLMAIGGASFCGLLNWDSGVLAALFMPR